MPNKATAAKPAETEIGGGIAFAPSGTSLPESANEALDSSFVNVGYVSTDGVTRSIGLDSTTVNAWGGAVAAVLSGTKTETFKFKVIEAYNVDLLGMVFGKATGTLDTGITVESNSLPQDEHEWVITMLETDSNGHRVVIPRGVITEIGDVVYVDNDVTGYELTLTAMADDDGNTAYDYYAAGTSSSGTGS